MRSKIFRILMLIALFVFVFFLGAYLNVQHSAIGMVTTMITAGLIGLGYVLGVDGKK